MFVEEIWKPFDEAGRPEQEWPRIREALERMRPLAAQGLLAVFQIAMAEAAEKAERAHPAGSRRANPLPKSGKSAPNGALAERPGA